VLTLLWFNGFLPHLRGAIMKHRYLGIALVFASVSTQAQDTITPLLAQQTQQQQRQQELTQERQQITPTKEPPGQGDQLREQQMQRERQQLHTPPAANVLKNQNQTQSQSQTQSQTQSSNRGNGQGVGGGSGGAGSGLGANR
jgi:hypothetical protein